MKNKYAELESRLRSCITNSLVLNCTLTEAADALNSLATQVEALTAERDAALSASRYETDLCGQALADLKTITAERDWLKAIADSDDGAGGDGMRLHLENIALKADAEKWRAREARNQALINKGFLGSPLRSRP